MYFEKWFPVDLLKLPNHVLDVGMPLFVGDNDAIRIGATVQRGGEDENITGTVKGYVILPNGADIVPFDGSKDGNKAWLDLPSDALCLSGRIQIAIRVFDGSAVTTLLATSATVRRADADQHFDPEDVVGDITDLIHEAETAAASAQEAAETAQEAITLAENIVSYTAQNDKTIVQKAQALANIGAIQQGKLPLGNILADKQNVHGTNTVTGRTVTVDGNKITYSRTGSGSTWRDISLTGNTLNAYSVNSSSMPSSTLNAGDFVTIPKAFSLANKRRIYLWLYSPDNTSLTFGASGSSGNRFQIATRPAEGDDTIDDGRYFNLNAGGYYVVLLAKTYPSIYSAIVTNGNIAVYYMTKNTTSAADGTLYWGIGIADHDLYDEETITDTEVTITADSGITYNCTASAVTSLSFTPSSSGLSAVRFKSGTTPTVLTVPNTVKWPSWFNKSALEISTTYELIVSDGVYGAVMTWAT